MKNSPVLLFIETSSEVCSVALSMGSELVSEVVVKEPKAHARLIAPMIESVLKESGIDISGTDAVVVSEGPGSYTGLRVGVSIAKGLCYGSGKPLIAVGSLDLLANIASKQYFQESSLYRIIPMIDARRMEVYSAVYDSNAVRKSPVVAVIVDENSFRDILDLGLSLFCGDGTEKVRGVINHPNALFTDINASAGGMLAPALVKFHESKFEDVAYFEPFYLKDFVAGISKKSLFGL
jgi:tRNA threonylcarbamoyladenosine biosynthesis protein TsaB